MNIKVIMLSVLITLAISACKILESSHTGGIVSEPISKPVNEVENPPPSKINYLAVASSSCENCRGEGVLYNVNDSIDWNISKEEIYQQVYRTLEENDHSSLNGVDRGNESNDIELVATVVHDRYTVLGVHNIEDSAGMQKRFIAAAREFSEIPDNFNANYRGTIYLTDLTDKEAVLQGNINLSLDNSRVRGSARVDVDNESDGSLEEVQLSLLGKLGGENTITGDWNYSSGSIKGYDFGNGKFKGFIAGPNQEEVVGVIDGQLTKGIAADEEVTIQGAFLGKKSE